MLPTNRHTHDLPGTGDPPPPRSNDAVLAPRLRWRLSTRLLAVTIFAVMLAEVLIFVPSIAKFRHDWLAAKLETAAVAGLAAEQSGAGGNAELAEEQEQRLLKALDAQLVAIVNNGASRLLAHDETLETVDMQIDLSSTGPLGLVGGAFDTLVLGGERTMRITGAVGDGSMVAEVVMSEAPLRRAMLVYSRNIFLLSLVVAGIAALLVYGAISLTLIRPIRAMTGSMISFGEKPSDPGRIIAPSGRGDELGVAEVELAAMQMRLAETLREQRHLADLGLAVSKINHDLRNILASAQLVSDRLAGVADPRVQRVVPMLLRSLDRALDYTRSVLAYGKAVESAPVKRRVLLRQLVDDVFGVLALSPETTIELVNAVAADREVEVDPDQFHRVLLNLCRNAVQALEDAGGLSALVRRITVGAENAGVGAVLVFVEDTGPGLPERARQNLFSAFRGSARTGGTGLGLAIAAEIVEAHGGHIALAERDAPGARFEIVLPRSAGARATDPARATHAGEEAAAEAHGDG